jgi:dTDP-glucose pyrophosphorylase
MKAIILAGGLETRISEQTQVKPKPMIEIVVADSSENLWGLSNKYPIKYYHCPNFKPIEKLRVFSKKISSELIK